MTAENRMTVINVSTSVPVVTAQQVPAATSAPLGRPERFLTEAIDRRNIPASRQSSKH